MMSNFNPYTPPQTNPATDVLERNDWPLASPGLRLAAAIWDWLVVTVLMLIVLAIYGALTHQRDPSWKVSAQGASGIVLYYVTWGLANWACLKQGQTLGKKLMKLKTIRSDGSPLDPVRYVSHRTLPIMMLLFVSNIGFVPLVSLLGQFILIVNASFIFRSDRRCIHDLIADTKVVKLAS